MFPPPHYQQPGSVPPTHPHFTPRPSQYGNNYPPAHPHHQPLHHKNDLEIVSLLVKKQIHLKQLDHLLKNPVRIQKIRSIYQLYRKPIGTKVATPNHQPYILATHVFPDIEIKTKEQFYSRNRYVLENPSHKHLLQTLSCCVTRCEFTQLQSAIIKLSNYISDESNPVFLQSLQQMYVLCILEGCHSFGEQQMDSILKNNPPPKNSPLLQHFLQELLPLFGTVKKFLKNCRSYMLVWREDPSIEMRRSEIMRLDNRGFCSFPRYKTIPVDIDGEENFVTFARQCFTSPSLEKTRRDRLKKSLSLRRFIRSDVFLRRYPNKDRGSTLVSLSEETRIQFQTANFLQWIISIVEKSRNVAPYQFFELYPGKVDQIQLDYASSVVAFFKQLKNQEIDELNMEEVMASHTPLDTDSPEDPSSSTRKRSRDKESDDAIHKRQKVASPQTDHSPNVVLPTVEDESVHHSPTRGDRSSHIDSR